MATEPILNKGSIFSTDFFLCTRRAYSGSLLEYIGYAKPGTGESEAGWLIQKRTYDGSDNLLTTDFAGNSMAFDKIWDQRKSYNYG
jgi:hypothetical protein